jgi:uncharacterized protein
VSMKTTLRTGTARVAAPVGRAIVRPTWSPLAVGPALGALNVASMGTSGHPLGVTSAFEDASALLARRFAPDAMRVNAYLETRDDVPRVGWEWALLAGVAVGSWASARAAGLTPAAVPERWAERFGERPVPRYAAAFLGGALLMFGARCARGCTSGHGISGTAQLALSSWAFTPLFFGVGAGVARLLFGTRGGR